MSVPVSLLQACHPEPAFAVTAVATALAAASGGRTTAVAAAFGAGQLATGWSNDWLDQARDRVAGRSDKPTARGDLAADTLGLATVAAVAACVPLSLRMGRPAGVAHLAAVASALSYNAGLKGTALSWAPYAVSFGLLPSIVTLTTRPPVPAPVWASTAGALLGVGAHLANALPDLADDARAGVRGLPHRLGERWSAVAAAGLLLGASAVLAAGPARPGPLAAATVGLSGAVTCAGLVAGRRTGSRAVFRAALVLAGLDVALLLARGAELTGG